VAVSVAREQSDKIINLGIRDDAGRSLQDAQLF